MVGDCVGDLAQIFEERWSDRDAVTGLPPRSIIHRHPDLTVVSDLAHGADRIHDLHLDAVRRAKDRVWIENAYFFPPRELLQALTEAARRGVDVRVIVPGKSDLPVCCRAARGEYRAWLRRGIQVFEYRRTVLHAKIALVDDDWSTVGTFNINPTSIACVHELNVFVRDPAFVRRVAEQLGRDFDDSERITVDQLRRWSLGERVGRFMTAKAFRLLERLLERRTPHLFWSRQAIEKPTDAPAD